MRFRVTGEIPPMDRRHLQEMVELLEYLAVNYPIDAKAEEYRRELIQYREQLRRTEDPDSTRKTNGAASI